MRSEKKVQEMNTLYNERRKVIEKVLAVMDHVQKDGMNESQACLTEGIDQRKFRAFIRKGYELKGGINQGPVYNGEYYSWEEQFVADLMGEDFYVLPDFRAAYERAISSLSPIDQKIIRLRYEDEMTLREIGTQPDINLCCDRVSQRIVKSMRRMRHPDYADMFRYGVSYKTEKDALKKAIVEADKKTKELAQERVRIQDQTKNMTVDDIESPSEILLKDMPLSDLRLSVRPYNALTRAGIENVYDLSRLSLKEIRKIRNLGANSIRECAALLSERGIPHEDWTLPAGARS
jgi:hypothetical protein